MAIRNNSSTWWGIIVAVAIVVGSGFYAKSSMEPNNHTAPLVASNAPASAGQTLR